MGTRGPTSPPAATERRAGSVFAVTLSGAWGRGLSDVGTSGTGRGDARSYGTQGKSGTHEVMECVVGRGRSRQRSRGGGTRGAVGRAHGRGARRATLHGGRRKSDARHVQPLRGEACPTGVAEVLDFTAARGAALRPRSPRQALRPRLAGVPGGMPVIAPMPAARPVRIPAQRDGTDEAVAAGTTVADLTETYRAHYRSLLGLAALLLDDTASCEDVVQEAFIRVHSARKRVRDPEKTLAYLRQTVVNLSRSALRRRILGLKLLSKPMPDMAS